MSSAMDSGPPKSGGSSTLTIVLVVGGILALVCCGVCGFVGLGLRKVGQEVAKAAKEFTKLAVLQPAEAAAIAALNQDAKVKEVLGEGIDSEDLLTYLGTGEVNVNDAPFSFTASGDKEVSVTVTCRAKQVDAIWQLTEIVVTMPDGSKHSVAPLKDFSPEINFDTGDASMPEEK